MADIGIFENDAFTAESLTASVNERPSVPKRLGSLGLFRSEPLKTTDFKIDKNVDSLVLIQNQDRNNLPTDHTGGSNRGMVSFSTAHLPTDAVISPSDIQDIRAFGGVSELEMAEEEVLKRLAKMRRRADATIEYQRAGAIKGLVLDADGTTVIEDIYSKFGIQQVTSALASGNKLRSSINAATDKVLDAVGDEVHSGFRALCGKNVFAFLQEDSSFVKAYERAQDGANLRNDIRRGVDFADVTFEQYRGGVGGVPFIADNEAYLIPEGVDDMFLTCFAPPNWSGFENTPGLEVYAMQEALPKRRGIYIELQTNPMSICTRPKAVIKLTLPSAA